MKVSSYAVARPAFYDRGAASNYNVFDNSAGPHGFTTRFTYTVPASTKLLIEVSAIEVTRLTVATVVARHYGRIFAGGLYINVVSTKNNTADITSYLALPGAITVYAAETVVGYTSDDSTGGTVYYNLATKGTLFNA